MEANTRFIKNIQNPLQSRANLCREPNALRLTTTKRVGGTRKLEIAEPHVTHKPKAGTNFLFDWLRNKIFLRRQLQVIDQFNRIILTKTIRDNVEAEKLLNRIEDARTERLLMDVSKAA